MLVKQCMTLNPITVQEDTFITEAQQILKQRRIRKLPVMEGDTLVGIVTDRDLRDVTPSKATALDIWELHYLLSKMTVKEAMTPNPITIGSDESVARAALLMQENHFESLPVVDDGKLVGIITESDIFACMVRLTGVREGGIEIEVELEDKPGSIKDVADVIRSHGLKIRSILCSYDEVPEGYRHVTFRVIGEGMDHFMRELKANFHVLGTSKN